MGVLTLTVFRYNCSVMAIAEYAKLNSASGVVSNEAGDYRYLEPQYGHHVMINEEICSLYI